MQLLVIVKLYYRYEIKRVTVSLTEKTTKRVFFTNEVFTTYEQQKQSIAAGKIGSCSKLFAGRSCHVSSPHHGISFVCFDGKRQLEFVEERSSVNANYYIKDLLPKLMKACHDLLGNCVF